MIKLVFCIRKSAGMSDEEFHRYWLDEHWRGLVLRFGRGSFFAGLWSDVRLHGLRLLAGRDPRDGAGTADAI